MSTFYNRIAGHSIERLAALSDGIFGVAMTLLVLDLTVPAREAVHSEHGLWLALVALAPKLVSYLMSFISAGIFWISQQTQLNHLSRADRHLAWIHIAFLFFVSMLPFSTALLSQFIHYRVALAVYWANIFLLGLSLLAAWEYAVRQNLVKENSPPDLNSTIRNRIFTVQAVYFIGALLCIVSTYLSIAVFVVAQLNYAIAPSLGWFRPHKD
jgi:uncharacterized membrane protein